LHDITWFLSAGRFDPAWVQAVALSVLVVLSLAMLIVLCIYARAAHSLARSSALSADAAIASSNAALAQIQFTIDKERGRVLIVPQPMTASINFRPDGPETGSRPFTLINVGPTAALNVSIRYRAVFTEFETEAIEPLQNQAAVADILGPNKDQTVVFRIGSGLKAGIPLYCYLQVRGEVTYNDVFSPEQHRTQFRYQLPMKYSNGVAGQTGEWVKCGTAEENSAS
jgi:hypothetical protein